MVGTVKGQSDCDEGFTSHLKGPVATQRQLIIAMGDCGAEPPRPSELSREVRNLNYHLTLFAFLLIIEVR